MLRMCGALLHANALCVRALGSAIRFHQALPFLSRGVEHIFFFSPKVKWIINLEHRPGRHLKCPAGRIGAEVLHI